MSDTTIGKVEFGPGRDDIPDPTVQAPKFEPLTEGYVSRKKRPPYPPRVPMDPLRDGTCIGAVSVWTIAGILAPVGIRLEHLEPWARTALERGLKAMQEDVL